MFISASNVKGRLLNHSAKHCEKNQVCAKCGGNHRLVECNANVEKCVNCERKGHSDLNHQTNGTKCSVYTRRKYQESKTELIMAVDDEVGYCTVV